MNKLKFPFLIIILSLILFNCNLLFQKNKPVETIPLVACDQAFSEPTTGWNTAFRIVEEEGIAYILEPQDSPITILAYDINLQEKKWRSAPFENYEGISAEYYQNLCFYNNSIWIFCRNRVDQYYYLLQIDSNDGEIQKKIILGEITSSDIYRVDGSRIVNQGSKIFFLKNGIGLCYIDTNALSLVNEEAKLYSVDVIPVLPYDDVDIFALYVEKIDNSIVYSYRSSVDSGKDLRGLIRYDLDSMEKIWDIKGIQLFDTFALYHNRIYGSEFPQISTEEELLSSYSWETGQLINSFQAIPGQTPPTFEDGLVIGTSPMNFNTVGLPYIYCLDAETLELKWKQDYPGDNHGIFSGSNVQVKNGIVYRPSSSGLWLYDLETGEILGVDKDIVASDSFNIMYSIKYNDILIIQTSVNLIGIRMNFVKTSSGLIKE